MSLLDRRILSVFDIGTLLVLALLLATGVVLVSSAGSDGEPELARKQAIIAVIGWLAALVVAMIDYRRLTEHAYLFWGLGVAGLVFVLLFGPDVGNARSWIHVGGWSLQPSEFAKVGTILALARLFSEREPRPFGLRGLLLPVTLMGIPFLLTAMQPDLGTALTFIPILIGIAWVAGLSRRTIGGLAATAAAAAPVAFFFLKDYQRSRLTTFLNPDTDPLGAGYQIMQSKIAVGSGGLMGKGLFSGTQSQLDFLPEKQNDFIVGLLGEELGFVGVAAVLSLFLLLMLRTTQAARLARERIGAYVAVGVVSLIGFHLAVNVGMVIGFAPITGIPLPLLSSGGSSALSTCLAVGLVVSIRSRRFLV